MHQDFSYTTQCSQFPKEAPSLDNYSPYANTLKNTLGTRVAADVYNALKEKAEIEDNRSVFY